MPLAEILFYFTTLLYLPGSYLSYRYIKVPTVNYQGHWLIATCSLILIIHGGSLATIIFDNQSTKISLGLTLSIAGWISLLLYFISSLIKRNYELGLLIFPFSLVGFVWGYFDSAVTINIHQEIKEHLLLAIPTYGAFYLAFVQALFLIFQENQLKKHKMEEIKTIFLPPLQTMENNLYWLTHLGFILLTANLLVGFIINHNSTGQWFSFTHHTFLSLITWMGFCGLLLGRWLWGWRGKVAAMVFVTLFATLFIAYFGTRFVREVILGIV